MNQSIQNLESRLEDANYWLRDWWQNNQHHHGLRYPHHDRTWDSRDYGHQALTECIDNLNDQHQLRFMAGESSVRLYNFRKMPYDFLEIQNDEYNDLKPGQSLDISRYRTAELPHFEGSLKVLYIGQTLFAHSVGLAESLANGGRLEIVGRVATDQASAA